MNRRLSRIVACAALWFAMTCTNGPLTPLVFVPAMVAVAGRPM